MRTAVCSRDTLRVCVCLWVRARMRRLRRTPPVCRRWWSVIRSRRAASHAICSVRRSTMSCRCSLCDFCFRNAGVIAGGRHRNVRLARICRLGRITRTFNRSDCCIFAGSTCTRIADRTRTRYDAPVVHSFHYHFSRAGTCVFHHLII